MTAASGLIRAMESLILAFRAGLGMYLGCWMIRTGIRQQAAGTQHPETVPWCALALYVGAGIVLELTRVLFW